MANVSYDITRQSRSAAGTARTTPGIPGTTMTPSTPGLPSVSDTPSSVPGYQYAQNVPSTLRPGGAGATPPNLSKAAGGKGAGPSNRPQWLQNAQANYQAQSDYNGRRYGQFQQEQNQNRQRNNLQEERNKGVQLPTDQMPPPTSIPVPDIRPLPAPVDRPAPEIGARPLPSPVDRPAPEIGARPPGWDNPDPTANPVLDPNDPGYFWYMGQRYPNNLNTAHQAGGTGISDKMGTMTPINRLPYPSQPGGGTYATVDGAGGTVVGSGDPSQWQPAPRPAPWQPVGSDKLQPLPYPSMPPGDWTQQGTYPMQPQPSQPTPTPSGPVRYDGPMPITYSRTGLIG